ncbi:hypothetical protein M9H77_31141 [Catharanthus roseus]|uniref:Uncharacterized protein n=1 Tax=Catharanthus roseus TaxID=4058 RepID=A0ACC0A1B1_CATRO|nr:hypothetical protein M9H77_31141 [Catharanthus roseus]
MNTKRREDKQLSKPLHGVTKVETLKTSTIEEFPKVNELPQAQEEVEESIVVHVEEEAIKEEYIEIKEKESVQEKERLVQRLCIFDSISILSKESELSRLFKRERK